ncbi:MAG TPA: hypothetical protein VGS57_05160 [Thermoanaerobaculia bacterium]|jgi:hypothetical protein|nr:hypothetical protein [Thermoanaerobaculia bacterium]
MPQLEILDRLIAVVVVLLLLSLLVQSIQSLFKQLMRFKSRQLESSLVDLFEAALGQQNAGRFAKWGGMSSLRLDRWSLRSQASPATRELVKRVLDQFRAIGRLTATAGNAIESLAKEDLLKVVGRVAPDSFVERFTHALQLACDEAVGLRAAMEAIRMDDLPGDASAAYARTKQALSPILADLATLLSPPAAPAPGQQATPPAVRADLLTSDILRLRDVSLDDVLQVLAGVQKTVSEQLSKDAGNLALKSVESGLKSVAARIAGLQRLVDDALSPLRARLASIETWYDTVMQGFEERHHRSMKAWALAISLFVVVFLNVNLLDVYRTSTANATELAKYEDLADRLLARAEKQKQAAIEQESKSAATDQENKPANTSAAGKKEPAPEQANRPANAGAAAKKESTEPAPDPLREEINLRRNEIATDLKTASTLGLGWRAWPSLPKDKKQLLAAAKRIGVGWLPAAFLVWLGAPFWHDVLEALFGLKRLVRKRADVKNVEEESGAGNPQP